MDTTTNNANGSPWSGTEGPGMTSHERNKAGIAAHNARRKQEPMAQMGHLIMSTILETHKGYPKEFADFIGWAAVGAVPDFDSIPNWPGFEPKKDGEEEA